MKTSIHQSLSVNTLQTSLRRFKSELHMQGVIYENQGLIAFEPNNLPNIIASEFNLNGNQGRIDLLVEIDEEIGIVELKNKELDVAAVTQVESYLNAAINNPSLFNNILSRNEVRDQQCFFGLLVGTSINEEALKKILDFNIQNSVRIYVIILNRYVTSNDDLFIVTNPIISPNSTNNNQNNRDYTKYLFEGKQYGKGRLVLAVLNSYLKQNPSCSLEELNRIFPSGIQGGFNMVESSETIGANSSRYFVNDPMFITNQELYVCSQWGIGNIGRFISNARDLNLIIETI